MTTRLKGLTVAFEQDIREDDAERIIAAIRCLRGVMDVRPIETTDDDWIIEERVRRERVLRERDETTIYAPPEAALRRTPLAAALVQAGASAQYAANQFEMALSDTRDAFARHMERTSTPMRIVVEPAPDTLPLTRAEAELFRDALDHLPEFVDEETSEAVMSKLRVFLRGVTS